MSNTILEENNHILPSQKKAAENRVIDSSLQWNVPLAKRVWFKTAGNADTVFRPSNVQALQQFMKEWHLPVFPLGVGSNIIIREGGIRGATIRLGRAFSTIEVQGKTVLCGAAALDKTVAQYCAMHSLGGLEFLYGIPGTIGGAVRMNAGAYGREIKDVLQWVEVIDRQGQLRQLSPSEIGFSYRKCQIDPEWVFIRAALQGYSEEKEKIIAQMSAIQEKRLQTQPQSHTGGSTFANPPGLKAWELIDKAGCRGLIKGGAQVSLLHCNFLINMGNATASDLEDLGEEVRQRVKDCTGIELQWEIHRIGEKIFKETPEKETQEEKIANETLFC